MAICVRYQCTKEDAEEVLQDSFVKIIKNLNKRDSNKVFVAWAKRITVNTNIDKLRKTKREQMHIKDLGEGQVYVDSGADILNQKMDADFLLNLIGELEPNQRNVFNLYAIDGYSHKEISMILKIAESSSRGLLFKARKRIQEKIKKHDEKFNFKRITV